MDFPCLLAELTWYRGPGFYYSLVKLLFSVVLYLCWVSACDWVNRDTGPGRMNPEVWNPVLLGCGLLAVLLLWATPAFLLGVFFFAAIVGGATTAYTVIRDRRVPPEKRIFSEANGRRLLRKYLKIRYQEDQAVDEDGEPKLPISFFSRGGDGKEVDPTAVARVETTKGYKAALAMVWEALQRRATDIHLEPTREDTSVRFRIDGIMHAADPFTRATGDAVVNIFKVLAHLDITEKRKPQDGGFSAEVDDRQVDFRVATAGSVAGEKLVMRVLDKASQLISLKQLGMRDRLCEAVRSVARLPHGMVVVCGPTGAGKSTTLYACLNELDRRQQNIITIENPVEYQLANVTQIEVNLRAGKTFASELRSILRQDPDVIMIGEIRDKETAEIACQAAQTGHMVFTTLHANDTVTAIGRLIDLGVQPFMISSALTAVLGQRLVRVLCPKCKEPYKPNPELLQRLNLPGDRIKYFYRPAGAPGADNADAEAAKNACSYCGGTGYHGRSGIFELLLVSDPLRALIREKPDLNDIRQTAIKGGMRSLSEDGLQLVIEGRTSIQELLRVSK
jgi:type II secretory ATPase GspE/PulE/Tfp pilus assembly ATPase PilB-like protein